MPWTTLTTLNGAHARLEPLGQEHCAALAEAVRDGELWRLWHTHAPEPGEMAAEIDRRLALREAGSMAPFAVIEVETGAPVGMTTFMNIDRTAPRVEIGATWYRASAQRGPINTECKFMLLRHAFETLGCIAVEFRTHRFNRASRRAIERLGAQLDGTLRNHARARDGTLRDTCVYSIIESEWPTVRAHLLWQMERPR
jgi:RimJ/RimL family protein N-acetyltransferase